MAINKKTKQLAVDTVLFGISSFGSKILTFLLTPLYTAVLMTEEYGTADLISTTVNLIYPLLTLVVSEATLRYTMEKDISQKAVLGNSLAVISGSILLLGCLYPAARWIGSEITGQLTGYWDYFVLTYAVFNIQNCFANFIKGLGKTKLFAVQGIVHTLTVIVCNIYFLLIRKAGLQGYLMSMIAGYAVPAVLMFAVGRLHRYLLPVRLDGKLLRQMLRYSMPIAPTLLCWSLNLYINKFMMIEMMPAGVGLGESGIFSVANKIPTMLTTVLSIFTQAWQLSAISNVNDTDESEYYTTVYGLMHTVSLVGCLALIPLSRWICTFLFDPVYHSAWRHIPFLTLAALFSCLSGFLAAAFRAHKRTGRMVTSVAAGAAANVTLSLILLPTVGVTGASVATAAGFFITWLMRMIAIQKLVRLQIPVTRTALSYGILTGACLLVCFEAPGAYAWYAAAAGLILLLNLPEVKSVAALAWKTGKQLLFRLKRG